VNVTINETYGDKPISEWLSVKVRDFVKEKYGLDVRITVVQKQEQVQQSQKKGV
jgi:hypothetical protein